MWFWMWSFFLNSKISRKMDPNINWLKMDVKKFNHKVIFLEECWFNYGWNKTWCIYLQILVLKLIKTLMQMKFTHQKTYSYTFLFDKICLHIYNLVYIIIEYRIDFMIIILVKNKSMYKNITLNVTASIFFFWWCVFLWSGLAVK